MTHSTDRVNELKLESLQRLLPIMIEGVLDRLEYKELQTFAKLNDLESYMHSNKPDSVKSLSKHIGSLNLNKRKQQAKNFINQGTQPFPKPNLSLISELSYGTPLLTVAKGKMYGLFILEPDNSITVVDDDNPLIFDGWADHCMNPNNFHLLAKELGCEYDNETFAYICHQWVENYLNSDWTKLHKFLPKQ